MSWPTTEMLNRIGEIARLCAKHLNAKERECVPWHPEYQRDIETPTCHDCLAPNLQQFFTAKALGYDVCPACFEQRQNKGRAKEVEG
jgi:hypothetical protein